MRSYGYDPRYPRDRYVSPDNELLAREARRVVERATVRNPALDRLQVTTRIDDGGLVADVTYWAPDRDSGERGQIIRSRRWSWVQLSTYLLRDNGRNLLWDVAELVRSVFVHEFEECFHVDGDRIHDPHKDEAPAARASSSR